MILSSSLIEENLLIFFPSNKKLIIEYTNFFFFYSNKRTNTTSQKSKHRFTYLNQNYRCQFFVCRMRTSRHAFHFAKNNILVFFFLSFQNFILLLLQGVGSNLSTNRSGLKLNRFAFFYFTCLCPLFLFHNMVSISSTFIFVSACTC